MEERKKARKIKKKCGVSTNRSGKLLKRGMDKKRNRQHWTEGIQVSRKNIVRRNRIK